MVSKGFPNVITSGRQYNIGEKPSVILYTYINFVVSLILILHRLIVWSKYSVHNSSVTFTVQTAVLQYYSQYLYHTRAEGSGDTVVKSPSVLERVGMMSDSICTGSDTAPTLHSCGSGWRGWNTCCSELCTAEAVHSTSTSRKL